MFIMVVMMLGAHCWGGVLLSYQVSQGLSHLKMMRKTM